MSEGCSAGWCAGRDWCDVACAADVFSRKWHPVVVYCLLDAETLRFAELADRVDDVSDKVLSDTLDDLEERGLVARNVVSERPIRVEYTLTERGDALEWVVEAMAEWGASFG